MHIIRLNRRSYNDVRYIAIVDDDDFLVLQKYSWTVGVFGTKIYATNSKVGLMHRFILKPPANKIVHHWDDNGLNNTRNNLEIITRGEHNRIHVRNPLGL